MKKVISNQEDFMDAVMDMLDGKTTEKDYLTPSEAKKSNNKKQQEMKKNEFVDVPGFEKQYQVNQNEEVMSLKGKEPKLMKQFTNKDNKGRYVKFSVSNKPVKKYVADLISETFSKPKPEPKPEPKPVPTPEPTSKPKRKRRYILQLDKDSRKLIRKFDSFIHAENETGVPDGNICLTCMQKRKTAGGFAWAYGEDFVK